MPKKISGICARLKALPKSTIKHVVSSAHHFAATSGSKNKKMHH